MRLCQRFVQGSHFCVIGRGALLILIACALARAVEPPALTTIALTGTDGRPAALDRYRGKPAVVFYEDRASTATNQAVMDAVVGRARRDDLLDAASVIAVANITAYNFFPARDIATAFIKRAETTAGIPILLDVDGTLMAPPWNLPGDASTILLLDRTGRIVWQHSGKLPPEQAEQMLDRLAEIAKESAAQP